MADFEFFKKEFEFRGKHAKMVGELWVQNDLEHTYFKRLVDVYVLAAVIGIQIDRREKEDNAPVKERSIFLDQMLKVKDDLDYIMQMMIILDSKTKMTEEEAVKKAFRGPETEEEYEYYKEMFDDYVRGGVEKLYECLVLRREDNAYYDEKTDNLMELVANFANVQ